MFGMGTGGTPPMKPPENLSKVLLRMRKKRVVATSGVTALDPGLPKEAKR